MMKIAALAIYALGIWAGVEVGGAIGAVIAILAIAVGTMVVKYALLVSLILAVFRDQA